MVRTPIDREGKELVMRTGREMCYFCGRDPSDLAEINEQIHAYYKGEIEQINGPLVKEGQVATIPPGKKLYYTNQELALSHNREMLELLNHTPEPVRLTEVKLRLPLKKKDSNNGGGEVAMTVWVCSICEGSIKHFKGR